MHYEFVIEDSKGKELSLRMTGPLDFLFGTLQSYGPDARLRMIRYGNGRKIFSSLLSAENVRSLSEKENTPTAIEISINMYTNE